jgi:hypothetical protein
MGAQVVRYATSADISWMIAELKDFDDFYAARRRLYPGQEEAERKLEVLIKNHVCLVAPDVRGFIAGLLAPHYMNDEIVVLTEVFWWVPKEHRRSRVGYQLLKRFTEHGRKVADWVIVTSGVSYPICGRIFERLGFRKQETCYLLEG